jgi:Protein of unknown function (DUF2946)
MDEQVKLALAKWPDVPDCTGWLGLDARGRWRIGEAKAGTRQPIAHAAMNAFINRNYGSHGRYWIFQNGPQRVFVELEYTPFVWRLAPREDRTWDLVAHTGTVMTPSSFWLDSDGRFLFEARTEGMEPAIGVVHDHDTSIVAELLRDREGALLDDETLSVLSASDPSERATAEIPAARLHWGPDLRTALQMPLQRIASHQVAMRFNFEPKPAIALRIDVDTRR